MGWNGRSEGALERLDWYPQDYLSDRKTRGMTLEEHGAYFLLLQFEWLDGPLPSAHDELADMLHIDLETFSRVWRRVGRCFEDREGRLVNPRLERERKATLAYRKERQQAGRKGAQAKWLSHSKSNGSAIK